ncbi:MAG: TadE/TadG family type IV pilus assembly protein [Erythrobacter sp.]
MLKSTGLKTRFNRVRLRASTILDDTRGNVLPIMAAALVPSMAMIGGGIDFGRAYLAESKLQGAVDAGALAAVRSKQLSSTSIAQSKSVGESYVEANFAPGYLGSTITSEKVEVTENNNIITAEIRVSGTIQTTLLRLVGIETLPFGATAVAESSENLPNAIEALLVLDNTGSMASGGKMAALKAASKDFVETVYSGNENRKDVAIGILPYNTMVNVGRLITGANRTTMLQEYPDYTDKNVSDPLAWKGCLFADDTVRNISSDPYTIDNGAFDITDNMPGDVGSPMPRFEPFIYPPIFVDSFQNINNRYKVPNDRNGIMAIPTVKEALVRRYGNNICVHRQGGQDRACDQSNSVVSIDKLPDKNDFKDVRNYSHKSGTGSGASPNNLWGPSPNYQCPAQALPIQYDRSKTSLKTYIDVENEALLPGTGTFHNAAMTWAYRLVTRDDVFPRDTPRNKAVKRVVIFMTDGNFDSKDDGRKVGGSKVLDTAYTAYRTYEDRMIISGTSKNDTIDNLEFRFKKSCEAMKADGLEIYTIAFALSNDDRGNRTREMFRSCATDRNTHFFSAANGADLSDAFVTIASELVNLRLVK